MRGSFAHSEGVQGATHSAQITIEFWTTSACERPQGPRQILLQHPALLNFAQIRTVMDHGVSDCIVHVSMAIRRQCMLTGQACSRAGGWCHY